MTQDLQAHAPRLDPAAFARAFPYHLSLDRDLAIRGLGRSLHKAMPDLAIGDPLSRHFTVPRPLDSDSIEGWRRHGRLMCTLKARSGCGLTLRGSAEDDGDGLLLLVAPVLTSIEAMRALGLGFNDFAAHDAIGEMLMLARTTWMSAQDTERLAARLQARSAQLDTILELGSNGVAAFDRAGLLQHTNGALLSLLGIDRSGTVGWEVRDFVGLLDRMRHPGTPPLGLPAGDVGPECLRTLHLVAPREATVRLILRHSDDGGRFFYLRDVTAETEVDRMKSEFLTTAAHELRTPMVSIFGFTELLLSRPVPEDRRKDMLETIHRQTGLLIHMVNELLDLARIESRQGKDLQRVPTRLGTLVEDTVARLAGVLDAHPVQVSLDHADALLMLDPGKTLQALTNVLSNADKYSASGRPIRIDSVDGEVGGQPAIGLRVVDQGLGMTAEQLARVFERFYRADPSGHVPGTGLGMCLVKEIVEMQQGRVQVDSEHGVGTTVTLWLPCMPEAGTDDARPSAGAEAAESVG